MSTLAFFLTQGVNALSQAALLFFLGVGLTLIFGIMRIINFAHGTLYMLGAFLGYSLVRWTNSYWLAMIAAPLAVGAIGTAFEFGILRRLYKRDAHAFLLVTFGLALITGEAVRLIWGSDALQVPTPPLLSGVVFMLDEPFPIYRLFLSGAGIVFAIAIWQLLERTRLGLLIRATSQNAEMVHALGTDVNLVRSAVFGIGCGLAALGGVLAAPLVTAAHGMAATAAELRMAQAVPCWRKAIRRCMRSLIASRSFLSSSKRQLSGMRLFCSGLISAANLLWGSGKRYVTKFIASLQSIFQRSDGSNAAPLMRGPYQSRPMRSDIAAVLGTAATGARAAQP